MLQVNQLIGFGAGGAGGPLIDIIGRLGLSSNLKLCLDAGDAVSYTSGQPWLDRSGNGYDFNRGATSGSEASDPTFTGTAGGLTSGEYFALDGGDYFTYDTTNEAFFESLHKDNALGTILAWFYVTSTASAVRICGTRGALVGHTGHILTISPGAQLNWVITNAGANALVAMQTATVSTGVWHMGALAIDEAAGAAGSHFYLDGTSEAFDCTYTSPAAGNSSYTMNIGAGGNGDSALLSGSRLAMFAMFASKLTPAQLDGIFNATRSRYGV